MKFSKLFVPTLRDDPADAEAISHKLLMRAGYVRQLGAGLYIMLPLGVRVMERINRILRDEMDAIGAQEIDMPALHPAEVWQQTGRWTEIGDEMFRLKDRKGSDMCLGMTHEEIMTWLAALEVRSYRDLPQTWYQIQTKFRDEARPKSGVLRTREFYMKDSYSFDMDEEGLNRNYQLHAEAYKKIFTRSGLRFYMVESDPGMMGGATAHEFMAPSEAGEDTVALCDACGYSANVELARSVAPAFDYKDEPYEEVETPNKRTIQEVKSFLKADERQFIKSVVIIADGVPALALVRGDQDVHEHKLTRAIGSFRPAAKEEIKEMLGVEAGFIGPIDNMGDRDMRIIADPTIKEGVYITGANKAGYHMRGVRPGEHFKPEWVDIHEAKAGDGCPECGAPMTTENCIEIGNIFKLGTRYSESLKAMFLSEDGKENPIIMGSYGIGPARIMAAAVEQNNDKDGMIWPEAIAPFDVEIIPLNLEHEETARIAGDIYDKLREMGLEVLFDDRDMRPGPKFKDADLIGIPRHIVIGERGLKEGVIELKDRRTGETRKLKPQEVLEALKG
jgi:prolyl-tRNA synthetase